MKTIAEYFLNLKKETDADTQVPEAQGVPNRIKPKRTKPRHVIKMEKIKDKENLKQQEKGTKLHTREFP